MQLVPKPCSEMPERGWGCNAIVEGLSWHACVCAGQEATIAAPAEAAQSTKNTSDLLRRWKEYATSFRVGAFTCRVPLPLCNIELHQMPVMLQQASEVSKAAM